MQHLEQRLSNLQYEQRAPLGLTEMAKVQDACRQANGAPEACQKVQHSTNAICDLCRKRFRELQHREPLNVTLPKHMEEQLMCKDMSHVSQLS